MGKTILVLTGSPRVGGNSDQLADAFIRGVAGAGNQVLRFDAGRKQIGPCIGCQACAETGVCAAPDDFAEFSGYLMQADAIAIFTPLYWFNWPAGLKAAIDKCFSFYCSGKQTRVKESILVVCGEANEMDVFDPLVKSYEKTAELMHWENKGHIVVPSVFEAGAVQNTPAIPGMEKIGRYF
jgi:multimeric flavodoxin WrbA